MTTPTVGLAMIVRDEAETLWRCLDSARAAFDEIVIVDTGSVDATKEIARRYTDRILDFAWIDDFAAARQFAFDRVECDWICWLDADDMIVAGAERVRPLLAALPAEVDAVCWPYVCTRDAWDVPRQVEWFVRAVRNNGSYRWSGHVHELLVSVRGRETRWLPEVVLEHHPEHHPGPRNPRRYLDRMEAAGSTAPRDIFILGHERVSVGDRTGAIEAFETCARSASHLDHRYQSWIWVGKLQVGLGRPEEARAAYARAIVEAPDWPDAYFALAELAYYAGDWPKVLEWADRGRALPPPPRIASFDPLRYASGWIIHYTNALFHLGRIDEALAWTRVALGVDPDDVWHRENLKVFASPLLTAPRRPAPRERGAAGSARSPR